MSKANHNLIRLVGQAQTLLIIKETTEDEARNTARRAYNRNACLSSANIGKAIGRSRQTVDSYIADLRAAKQMDTDISRSSG